MFCGLILGTTVILKLLSHPPPHFTYLCSHSQNNFSLKKGQKSYYCGYISDFSDVVATDGKDAWADDDAALASDSTNPAVALEDVCGGGEVEHTVDD